MNKRLCSSSVLPLLTCPPQNRSISCARIAAERGESAWRGSGPRPHPGGDWEIIKGRKQRVWGVRDGPAEALERSGPDPHHLVGGRSRAPDDAYLLGSFSSPRQCPVRTAARHLGDRGPRREPCNTAGALDLAAALLGDLRRGQGGRRTRCRHARNRGRLSLLPKQSGPARRLKRWLSYLGRQTRRNNDTRGSDQIALSSVCPPCAVPWRFQPLPFLHVLTQGLTEQAHITLTFSALPSRCGWEEHTSAKSTHWHSLYQ